MFSELWDKLEELGDVDAGHILNILFYASCCAIGEEYQKTFAQMTQEEKQDVRVTKIYDILVDFHLSFLQYIEQIFEGTKHKERVELDLL